MLTQDERSLLEATAATFCDARDYINLPDRDDAENWQDLRRTANALENIMGDDQFHWYYLYKPILARTLEPDVFRLLSLHCEDLKNHANLQGPKRQVVEVLRGFRRDA